MPPRFHNCPHQHLQFFTRIHCFLSSFNAGFHRSSSQCPPTKPVSLSLLADQCSTMDQIKQIHARMVISGRISDNFAASRIISFCALSSAGDLSYALKLMDETPEPNAFMWNTIIRAYASSANPSSAVSAYARMRNEGVQPGNHTFPFLLKACTGYHSLFSGVQVHGQVLKLGYHLDLYVSNGLIHFYANCGHILDARQVFDECPDKNLIIWTTMVSGYAQNFCSHEALRLFNQMNMEGVEPNAPTLASVLSACARSGEMDLGERIHLYINEERVELGVILGTALVDMYAKNGVISSAREVFDRMPARNIATWNAMICGLAMHGHGGEALELFDELEASHEAAPNDITFVGVLSACCHTGSVEVGRGIFHSMESRYGIQPKLEHYGCIIDLLGRGGRLVEAEELMKGMKWKPDVVVLGALLAACKNHGNVEIAERVVKAILELEPNNHGVYVGLSNIYAEAGRWEDVMRLRKTMREVGLKKIPACSLVDGDR